MVSIWSCAAILYLELVCQLLFPWQRQLSADITSGGFDLVLCCHSYLELVCKVLIPGSGSCQLIEHVIVSLLGGLVDDTRLFQ